MNNLIYNEIKKCCLYHKQNNQFVGKQYFINRINAGIILYEATRTSQKRWGQVAILDESISKRNMVTIDKVLSQNTNFGSKQIAAFKTYVSDRTGIEQLAMAKWIGNGSMKFPEDIPLFNNVINICKAKHKDPLSYNSPGEIERSLITNNIKLTKSHVSPEDYPTVLTNKKEYPLVGITVYDVENSQLGQQAIRNIMNDQLTVNGHYYNCWCLLLVNTTTGKLTNNAWSYWQTYSAIQKKVAFYNGKIIAFCASDHAIDCDDWWDLSDKCHDDCIPVEMPIKNDEFGRNTMYEFNPESGELYQVSNTTFKGNKKNGVYQEWEDDVLICTAHYKHGQLNGEYEEYNKNTQTISTRTIYKNDQINGKYQSWYESGKIKCVGQCVNGSREGIWEYWYPSGKHGMTVMFKNDMRNGDQITYSPLQDRYQSGQRIHDIKTYKNDKIISKRTFHHNNQVFIECTYDDQYYTNEVTKSFKIKQYYDTGRLKCEGIMWPKKNIITNFVQFYESGQIEYTGEQVYLAGQSDEPELQGHWIHVSLDNDVIADAQFDDTINNYMDFSTLNFDPEFINQN